MDSWSSMTTPLIQDLIKNLIQSILSLIGWQEETRSEENAGINVNHRRFPASASIAWSMVSIVKGMPLYTERVSGGSSSEFRACLRRQVCHSSSSISSGLWVRETLVSVS